MLKLEKLDPEQRAQCARDLFTQGYNCSQSVVLAFEDIIAIDRQVLATVMGGFGGGMGRMREVCGAVSGMTAMASLLCPMADPKNLEAKRLNYQHVQQLADGFRERNGAIVCRELLGLSEQKDSPEPSPRTEHYYHKRPCAEYCADAARLVAQMINSKIQ